MPQLFDDIEGQVDLRHIDKSINFLYEAERKKYFCQIFGISAIFKKNWLISNFLTPISALQNERIWSC